MTKTQTSTEVTKLLAAKRKKLNDVQQASQALTTKYEETERAYGSAAANDRVADVERLDIELADLAKAIRRTAFTIEALEAEIAQLQRHFVEAQATEEAHRIAVLVKRCQVAAAKADDLFAGPARQAVRDWIEAASALGAADPEHRAAYAIAGYFWDLTPEFRAIGHVPGGGSASEQHRTFAKATYVIGSRAARPPKPEPAVAEVLV